MNAPEKLELPLVVKDTDGNEHEVDRLVYRLDRDDKSRYHELFGTPERAARTITRMQMATDLMGCCDADTCSAAFEECWKQESCPMDDYDVLLEWLRGDA